MVSRYARFSKNNPFVHYMIISFILLSALICTYLVLNDNILIAFLGTVLPIPIFIFFGKSSEYKRKFIHD